MKNRRNGRPPIDASGAGTKITAIVTAATFDALYRRAAMRGLSISDVIRSAIDAHLARSEDVSAAKTHTFSR